MSRSRKLLTAGGILTLGLVLAWPFRQTLDHIDPAEERIDDAPRALNGDPIAVNSTAPGLHKFGPQQIDLPIAPQHVAARMASTNESLGDSKSNQGLESFDLANHPSLQAQSAASQEAESQPPVNSTSSDARPVYNVVDRVNGSKSPDDWPQEVLHVVRNGDTLEGLAERYLDDAGRGLEIFDLNRDQLSNPYLLPIGVELRIPAQASRPID